MDDEEDGGEDFIISVAPHLQRRVAKMRAAAEATYGPVRTKREHEQRERVITTVIAVVLMAELESG